MKTLTQGTRRSSFPAAMFVNGITHKQKLDKYIKTGYEVVSENGFSALLAYFPYKNPYVKLVSVEHGRVTSKVQITPKQLNALCERVNRKRY